MDLLRKGCLQIEPSFKNFEMAEIFLTELMAANRKFNLVSRANEDEGEQAVATTMIGHFLDCFLAVPQFLKLAKQFSSDASQEKSNFPSQIRLLDVGSGGGFPAIVLALAIPEIAVHAIESKQKKVDFLQSMRVKLGLKNFRVFQDDVSSWRSEQKYHIITARAFSTLAKMINQTWRLLAGGGTSNGTKDGVFAFYKGREAKVKEEVAEIFRLQSVKRRIVGKKISTIPLGNLFDPFPHVQRCLVVIK